MVVKPDLEHGARMIVSIMFVSAILNAREWWSMMRIGIAIGMQKDPKLTIRTTGPTSKDIWNENHLNPAIWI